ncbi:MAG: hypothetical protein WBX11_02825 [Thiobacillaceae bacterium]
MNHGSDKCRNAYRLVLVVAAMLISGCAELASIYRSQDLATDKAHIVSIDAKQRVVLTNPSKSKADGAATALLRFCAEPPPDVFTALAASLGAEASVSKSANSEAAAKLAATLSENAATIERTQTVNILRETMYRNCERYLSGAIGEEEFIVQAARDQQLIVQVLAVEQITGVARAQSTALTTIAKAAAGGVSDASLQVLSDAKKDIEAKRAASAKAAADAAALPPAGPCGASPIDTASPPAGVTAEQTKAKNDKCADATTAAKLTQEAESYFQLVQQTVAKQGEVSSETQGQLASSAQSASEASVEIAEKVVEIVKQYHAFDEIGMTCVVKLRTETDPPEYCKALLQQMADTRAAQLKLEEEGVNATRIEAFKDDLVAHSKTHAEIVWIKLGSSFAKEALKALADKAGIKLADAHQERLVKANTNLSEFSKAFAKIPIDQQVQLANAAK